jgi:hypothetical protein
MRTWVLAVAALTLVALTRPIAAGEKRSSALAVRVTVVRSCSVNTDNGTLTGTVTCGSRFGPPVMSASSTIRVPLSTPPEARVDATNLPQIAARRQESSAVQPPPEAAAVERMSTTASERSPAAAVARGDATAPADDVSSGNAETVAFSVVTVNF